jgi:hypothetical protein
VSTETLFVSKFIGAGININSSAHGHGFPRILVSGMVDEAVDRNISPSVN